MILYERVSQKNYKKITGVVMLLISVAAGMFLVTSMFREMPYRWAVQLLGFICLCAVVYITVKYVSKNFVYVIEKKKDGSLDLVIDELSNGGKKRVTVCRVSLGNIEQVCTLDKRNETDKIKAQKLLAKAKSEKRSTFDYCQDIAPKEVCYILVTECEEPLLLKLLPDSILEDHLTGKITSQEE